jgi:hypothetical protein
LKSATQEKHNSNIVARLKIQTHFSKLYFFKIF